MDANSSEIYIFWSIINFTEKGVQTGGERDHVAGQNVIVILIGRQAHLKFTYFGLLLALLKPVGQAELFKLNQAVVYALRESQEYENKFLHALISALCAPTS